METELSNFAETDLAEINDNSDAKVFAAIEVSREELYKLAENSYVKGNWEAAETMFQKLFEQESSSSIYLPKIFMCILNKHEQISKNDINRLTAILTQLENDGDLELVANLRQQLENKINPPQTKKKWWQFGK